MTEEAEIKRDGGRAMKNSGRGRYQKGDSRLSIFTVDYKEYPKGMRIDLKVWTKICRDAFSNDNSEPLLKIILGEGMKKTRLCVVSEDIINDYIRLLEVDGE